MRAFAVGNRSRIRALAVVSVLGWLATPGVEGLGAQELPPTVDKVIELHKSGIPENILVMWIRQANTPQKLSPDDLLKLSGAKVPERAIQALMDPLASPQPTGLPPDALTPAIMLSPAGIPVHVPAAPQPSGATTDYRTPAGDPNDPLSPHDSGIYLYETLPTVKMTLLEPTAYQGAKVSAFMNRMLSELIPKTTRAIIPGKEASIRASGAQPVFYFYFEDRAAGLGKAGFLGGISSPNQFVLVKLECKKNSRETIIARDSLLGGSSGTSHKAMVTFKSERLKAGLYKIVFPENLAVGEYAFMVSSGISGAQQAGAASPIQIFDFAVDILK